MHIFFFKKLYHRPHFKWFKLCIYLVNIFINLTIATKLGPVAPHVVGNGADTEIRAREVGDLLVF